MKRQKDFLIFLSDQHRKDWMGCADNTLVRTPWLDRLAQEGTRFDSAYTACPFCVPARVSFLSAQAAMHTQVYTNHGAIREDTATFLHSLAAEGYETVLCGRMHFEGHNQRHGFTKRIFGDLLQLYPGQEDAYKELAHYRPTISETGCTSIVGGGEHSPTLDYDRQVIAKALEYLEQAHDKPQCIVVGTYAPHFPFVGPPQLYEDYLLKLHERQDSEPVYNYCLSPLQKRYQRKDRETVMKVRAAYSAMVENLDRQIGQVYTAWLAFLARRGTEGIFVYTSDHGEALGERDLYAKKTLFENAAGIPLLFCGEGVKANAVCHAPVSLMDVGLTLCDAAEAQIPYGVDGASLLRELAGEDVPERVVFSECIETVDGAFVPGIMARKGRYKLIRYWGYENETLLFDLENDPFEANNLFEQLPEIAVDMNREIEKVWHPTDIIAAHTERTEHIKILMQWGRVVHPSETERWHIPSEALEMPRIR